MPNYQWYLNSKREKLIEEIKKIPDKKDLSKIIEEALEHYLKVHGSGNPAYSLDQFKDPDFKITPAFGESLDKKWRNFIEKSTKKEAEEISWKAEGIMKLARRKFYES